MRDWLTASDEWLSPQAAVLSPAATMRIAGAIVAEATPYRQTVAAGRAALAILSDGAAANQLRLSRKERQWLSRVGEAFEALPQDESEFVADMESQYGSLYDRASYGLEPSRVAV